MVLPKKTRIKSFLDSIWEHVKDNLRTRENTDLFHMVPGARIEFGMMIFAFKLEALNLLDS